MNKHPDDWNEIHKPKPQPFSSINILVKLQITIIRITNTTYHWVVAYFIDTKFFFLNDSYSFTSTSTAS